LGIMGVHQNEVDTMVRRSPLRGKMGWPAAHRASLKMKLVRSLSALVSHVGCDLRFRVTLTG
jgi:hypothetical protein